MLNLKRLFVKLITAGAVLFFCACSQVQTMQPLVLPCPESSPVSIHCGKVPSLAVDKKGKLWAVFVQGGHVYLTGSKGFGKGFSIPVTVNEHSENIYSNGENRPKLAFARQGGFLVTWAKKTPGMYTGDIRFSRSIDGGKTFETVKTLNDDGLIIGHRFDSLQVDTKGDVYVIWLDKRDKVVAKAKGKEYRGTGIYYTVSSDSGKTFTPNYKIADHTCECCRISSAPLADSGVGVTWRHIFKQEDGTLARDHAFTKIDKENIDHRVQRISVDNWQINACPHHGPSMVMTPSQDVAITWFTAAENKKGIYYGLFSPETGKGGQSALRYELSISANASASHPYILDNGGVLSLAWKEFDGERTVVYLIQSVDYGKNWLPKKIIASSTSASDHPHLFAKKNETYLAWHTSNEGLRIVPID